MAIFKNNKKISYHYLLCIITFGVGFWIYFSPLLVYIGHAADYFISKLEYLATYHCNTLQIYPDAWHYFLFPKGGYIEFYTIGLSRRVIFPMISNAFFNSIFQPLFLCVFTPQVILNLMLFPFFLYGAIKYFKRVSLMILLFIGLSVYIGMSGSIVEPLIRHRLSCELIYLSISLAGFERWITKGLS